VNARHGYGGRPRDEGVHSVRGRRTMGRRRLHLVKVTNLSVPECGLEAKVELQWGYELTLLELR
jgi:hypothetical protein